MDTFIMETLYDYADGHPVSFIIVHVLYSGYKLNNLNWNRTGLLSDSPDVSSGEAKAGLRKDTRVAAEGRHKLVAFRRLSI